MSTRLIWPAAIGIRRPEVQLRGTAVSIQPGIHSKTLQPRWGHFYYLPKQEGRPCRTVGVIIVRNVFMNPEGMLQCGSLDRRTSLTISDIALGCLTMPRGIEAGWDLQGCKQAFFSPVS